MLWGDDGFGVFVKRVKIPEGVAEIKGLNLIRRLAGVRTRSGPRFLDRIARTVATYD